MICGFKREMGKYEYGCKQPEDYGGYYYWGETGMWNDYYDREDTPEDISGTKYDIAHVKWGGDWHLPTSEQVNELLSKCTLFWIKQKKKVARVTGPNGR